MGLPRPSARRCICGCMQPAWCYPSSVQTAVASRAGCAVQARQGPGKRCTRGGAFKQSFKRTDAGHAVRTAADTGRAEESAKLAAAAPARLLLALASTLAVVVATASCVKPSRVLLQALQAVGCNAARSCNKLLWRRSSCSLPSVVVREEREYIIGRAAALVFPCEPHAATGSSRRQPSKQAHTNPTKAKRSKKKKNLQRRLRSSMCTAG